MAMLAVLGRQPEISLAELMGRFPGAVERVGTYCARIDADDIDIATLGGTIKLGRVINELPLQSAQELTAALRDSDLATTIATQSEGKLSYGLSLYGYKLSPAQQQAMGLELKKSFKQLGRNARFVASKGALTAAQITHNQLLNKGADIWVVKTSSATLVATTTAVQDIAAYTERDHGRPARSAKVGMLPPKLAQVMINLAAPAAGSRVLDPFCGTGVILQEASLMGYGAYGSDIEPELIAMSERNEAWLREKHPQLQPWQLEVGDATTHTWSGPIGAVVSEGYLGPALSSPPTPEQLTTLQADARRLTLDFLRNLASQIAAGTPVCLTLPAWRTKDGFTGLNLLDQIESIGYTFKEFLPVTYHHLLYSRPDQVVARQITVLTRI